MPRPLPRYAKLYDVFIRDRIAYVDELFDTLYRDEKNKEASLRSDLAVLKTAGCKIKRIRAKENRPRPIVAHSMIARGNAALAFVRTRYEKEKEFKRRNKKRIKELEGKV